MGFWIICLRKHRKPDKFLANPLLNIYFLGYLQIKKNRNFKRFEKQITKFALTNEAIVFLFT